MSETTALREKLLNELEAHGVCDSSPGMQACCLNWPTDPASWCLGCLTRSAAETLVLPPAFPDDYEWAYERVTKMADMALTNAGRNGAKLLRGFGYPDEAMSFAQDARALQILLSMLPKPDAL